jgi:hypothetical protein
MNVKQILNGIYGGLAGGLVFGVMMAKMGTLPMIGKMVGQPHALAGFSVHLVNSAIIGAGFAIIAGWIKTGNGRSVRHSSAGLVHGLLYGGLWWLLGPLTLMPLFLGMGFGVNWNLTAAAHMLPSLSGHLIYGAILGISYAWLQGGAVPSRSSRVPRVSAAESN